MSINISSAEQQAAFLKCIGEPTRLVILKLLTEGEKCVSEIVDFTGIEQPLISHHLKALRNCNIVTCREHGAKVIYHLTDKRLANFIIESEELMLDLCLCAPGCEKESA